MKVILNINGYLNTFFEEGCYEFKLEDDATLADLMAAIDCRFGESIPKSVWSRENKKFRGPVSISINQKIVKDHSFPLEDEQRISISRFLVGG